ncbi:MAG: hypothetical protein AB2A00_40560 [Myxococcota bacterium]
MRRGIKGLVMLGLVGGGVLAGCPNPPRGVEDRCNTTGQDAGTAAVSGVLETGRTNVDYNGGFAQVDMVHVSSASAPDEDGCVSQVDIILTTASQACRLALTFKAGSDIDNLTLTSAALDVGATCPDWSEADRTLFQYQGNGVGLLSRPTKVSDDGGTTMLGKAYCSEVSLRMSGLVDLEAPGHDALRINLQPITLDGHARSQGDLNANCLCTGGTGC